MKPLDIVNLFLVLLIALSLGNYMMDEGRSMEEKYQSEYSRAFKQAVQDTAFYVSQFEAQQRAFPYRYSKEKEIEISTEALNIFYQDLAARFDVTGNPNAVSELMMYMPVSVLVGYDGYQLVTLDSKGFVGEESTIKPFIWPERPYVYKCDSGVLVYFTLGTRATIYDPNTNQYFEGTYKELSAVRNLSPLNTEDKYNEIRVATISDTIGRDMAAAVERHATLVKNMGVAVDFYLPKNFTDEAIDSVGFYSFLQGYPLLSGDTLTTYAFSGARLQVQDLYVGTQGSDGVLKAYSVRCGVPAGVTIIETFRDEREAAMKGYFPQKCLR